MNPVAALALVGGVGLGLSMALRKSNAAEAQVNSFWARVAAGEDPLAIVRGWALEGNPDLTAGEVAAILGPDFLSAKADHLVAEGNLGRGLEADRVTATGRVTPHWGLDITAREGMPVHAAKTGVVTLVTGSLRASCGLGHFVGLSHLARDQESTLYMHLQYVDVGLGQLVEGGEQLGRVGRTNFCGDGFTLPDWGPGVAERMGAHLHFEVHPRRVPVVGPAVRRLDPVQWCAREEIALADQRLV